MSIPFKVKTVARGIQNIFTTIAILQYRDRALFSFIILACTFKYRVASGGSIAVWWHINVVSLHSCCLVTTRNAINSGQRY